MRGRAKRTKPVLRRNPGRTRARGKSPTRRRPSLLSFRDVRKTKTGRVVQQAVVRSWSSLLPGVLRWFHRGGRVRRVFRRGLNPKKYCYTFYYDFDAAVRRPGGRILRNRFTLPVDPLPQVEGFWKPITPENVQRPKGKRRKALKRFRFYGDSRFRKGLRYGEYILYSFLVQKGVLALGGKLPSYHLAHAPKGKARRYAFTKLNVRLRIERVRRTKAGRCPPLKSE